MPHKAQTKKIKLIYLNNFIFLSILFVIAFTFSLYFLEYFIGGDQLSYHRFYDGIPSYNFFSGFSFFKIILDANEPVYYTIIWLASRVFEKNLFISIVNAFFIILIYIWLKRRSVHWSVMLLLSMNFYLIVLLFSAERLKFGYLFFILSSLLCGYPRYFFSALSICSHLQMSMLYVSILSGKIMAHLSLILNTRVSYLKMGILILLTFCSIIFFGYFIYLMLDQIYHKISFYYYEDGLGSDNPASFKPILFLLLSCIYSRNIKAAFLSQLILIILGLILGDSRINIMSYTVFLMFALEIKRGLNLGVIITSLYYFIKGIIFLNNILIYGDGFN